MIVTESVSLGAAKWLADAPRSETQTQQQVPAVSRAGRGGAEPERLVQGERGSVALVRVQLHAGAAAGPCALEDGGHERPAEALPTGPVADEQVLEAAVVGRGPDRMAVAHLADAVRRITAEQELGVGVAEQALERSRGSCGRPGRRSPASLGTPMMSRATTSASAAWASLAADTRQVSSAAGPPAVKGGAVAELIEVPSGLEGVIAFDTEIAEPDKEGGALRYRGVDIEELVGACRSRRSGACSWTAPTSPACRPPSRIRSPCARATRAWTSRPPSRCSRPEWGLGQLIDIGDEEARDHLARVSVMALSFVAQSARGIGQPAGAAARGGQGAVDPGALPDPLARRGGPEPRQGDRRLLDLRRRARHERLHLHRAHRRVHRRRRGRRAVGAAWALSPARFTAALPRACCTMLDGVEETGDAERYVKDMLDRGDRLMGFGHRVYRAEDPRARVLRRTAREIGAPRLEVAERLEAAALAELKARKPDRVLATNVEFWSAVVLDYAHVPPELFTPLFSCARVAGWSAHIMEQKREGRLIRPSARYVGPPPRSATSVNGGAARGLMAASRPPSR